jgi:hypothetical protein
MSKSTNHANKGQGREDGEEDVVGQDKVVEGAGFADAPWPVSSLTIESVQEYGSRGVEKANCDWDFPAQNGIVDVGRDRKWAGKGTSISWRRESSWNWIRRP